MSKYYEIKTVWNGKRPKRDLNAEYAEDLIYILYNENKLECWFESVKLIHGLLRHDHSELEKIRYHHDRPVAVKGYLPLGCLRIKGKKRKNERAVI